MKYSLVLMGVVFMFIISCKQYTGKEYHDWISAKENGLIKSIENNSFKIDIQYKPVDYLIASDFKNKELTQEEYKKEVEERSGLQYFTIKLQSKTGEAVLKTALVNDQEYSLRMSYYINGFEKDLILIDGADTLTSKLYHFERTYGIASFNNISVAFENPNNNQEKKELLILDRALGFGLQKIEFKKRDLLNIPTLKIK